LTVSPLPRNAVVAAVDLDGISQPVAVAALRGSGILSVKDLGAVGDGRSHPLRQRFSSLARAQAEFPHATSLDDELDWAATQGAINLVAAQGGGHVVSPAGTYLCNRMIVFPECRSYGRRGVQVNWIGEGALATVYRWPDDLGPESFAVHCPRRYEPAGMYEGLWQDIGLEGPGAEPRLGVAPAQMDGWGWGARRRMVRCSARRFRAGVNVVGDHSQFQSVISRENLYGIYFARASRHLYGDLLFEKCMFSGCTLAAVAVHPGTQMGGCTMLSCYMGGSPYSIMKEAGEGQSVMVGQSIFLNCMFEYVGNAWLHDENTPRRAIVRNTTFDTCYFQWQDKYRLTTQGRARRAVWDFHSAEHVRWLQPKEPFALKPGEDALLRVIQSRACVISGHVGHIIRNCQEAGKPLLHPDAVNAHGHRSWQLDEPGGWSGRLLQVTPGDAVQQGDVLEMAEGGRVRRGSRSPAPVAGICMMDARPGEITVVAVAGTSLRVRCAEGVSDMLLAKGPDGMAVRAGPSDPALIGWSNGVHDGRAFVALRGLA
jgi:hypothetical protein